MEDIVDFPLSSHIEIEGHIECVHTARTTPIKLHTNAIKQ